MPEDEIPIKNPFSDDYDEWDFGDDIFFGRSLIIQKAKIAEQRIEIAEQSIVLISQIKQIFLLDRKVTDEKLLSIVLHL